MKNECHDHLIEGVLCRHVINSDQPILQVIHWPDGMWEFSCGIEDHTKLDDFIGICGECRMKKMVEYQLLEGLDKGQWAERENGNQTKWALHFLPPEEGNVT